MLKSPHSRATFGRSDVEKVNPVVLGCAARHTLKSKV